jgi:hypothetical protein
MKGVTMECIYKYIKQGKLEYITHPVGTTKTGYMIKVDDEKDVPNSCKKE